MLESDLAPLELEAACRDMGLDRSQAGAVLANAESASSFHFGHEGDDAGATRKVYLEFASRLAQSDAPVCAESVLLYLAWKWKAGDPRSCTIARYECFPGLQASEQLARVARIAPESAGGVGALVNLAVARSGRPPMYLEVTEERNPRRSFDINFHAAAIPVASLGSWLAEVGARLSIPAAAVESALDAAGDALLGHLSGGTSREGREFLTVYHPAEPPWHA